NSYTRGSGTSFSAPLVAGLAACLIQARPTWPPVMIIQAMKHSALHAANPDTLHAPELKGPLALQLSGPNPLRAGATPVRLRITLGTNAAPANYRVRILDASGRVVRDLGAGSLSPGSARDLVWTGDDAHGHSLAPGLYFVSVDGAS